MITIGTTCAGRLAHHKSFVDANRPVHTSSMSDFVESKRLVLRQFTSQAADLLIELDSDPAVMRYLTGGEPELPAALVRDQVIPSVLNASERWNGRFGLFAAYEKETGAFIGWFHLRPEPRVPAPPGRLGQGVRDRGLAGACGQGLLRARRQHGLGRDDGSERFLAEGDGEGRHVHRRVAPDT